MHLLRGQF
jgi:hypothetical protein